MFGLFKALKFGIFWNALDASGFSLIGLCWGSGFEVLAFQNFPSQQTPSGLIGQAHGHATDLCEAGPFMVSS